MDDSKLFLPEGRVHVSAELIDYEWIHGAFEGPCYASFKTNDGHSIVYKGASKKLLLVTLDEFENKLEFESEFKKEVASYGPVSSIVKPSKIKLIKKAVFDKNSFTGGNAKFAKSALGHLALVYVNDLKANLESMLFNLEGDSILGESFDNILKQSKMTGEMCFGSHGIVVRIEKKPTTFHMHLGDRSFQTDISKLTKYLKGKINSPLDCCYDDNSIYLIWEDAGIEAALRVGSNQFEFKINKLKSNVREEHQSRYKRRLEEESKLEYYAVNDTMVENLLMHKEKHLNKMLALGLDINATDSSGHTLLHLLIGRDHDVSKLLVKRGIALNTLNKNQWSALYFLRCNSEPNTENKKFHKWLLDQGAVAKPNLHSADWEI